MTLSKIFLAASTTALLFSSPTFAQQNSSANYSETTNIDLDACHFITNEELGLPPMTEEEEGVGSAQWLCIGYNRAIVHVAEGDLRMFVSFGANALREKSAHQTLPAFNILGDTIEWRISGATQQPFATIYSLYTESGEMAEIKGEILVVTKLEPGNSCHMAYIDVNMPVLANQQYDPHQIARDIADGVVPNFDCANDDILMIPS